MFQRCQKLVLLFPPFLYYSPCKVPATDQHNPGECFPETDSKKAQDPQGSARASNVASPVPGAQVHTHSIDEPCRTSRTYVRNICTRARTSSALNAHKSFFKMDLCEILSGRNESSKGTFPRYSDKVFRRVYLFFSLCSEQIGLSWSYLRCESCFRM